MRIEQTALDLRQLRYFIAIAEAGSFSLGAQRVHVAQSALSAHVRRMEDVLGVQLLVREAKGVVPTEAGAKLLLHARAIIDQVRAAEQDVRSESDHPSGDVTIGIPSGVGRILNAPLLEVCKRDLPRISLRIVEVLPGHVREWLAGDSIKLGVHYALDDERGESALLAQEDFFLLSPASEANVAETVAFETLVAYPLVLPTCNYNPQQCVATLAAAKGISLNIDTRVDSLGTIIDLVCNSGRHAVLTPASFLPEWTAGKVAASRIEPGPTRRVLLSYGRSAGADPAVKRVHALVCDLASTLVARGAWPRRVPSIRNVDGALAA